MKKILAFLAFTLALAATAPPAYTQNLSTDTYILTGRRDLDATSNEYCRTVGLNGAANDRNIPGRVLLAAGAGSTTVTGTNAFANVAVGDVLFINVGGAVLPRTVDARASASSITVDLALNAAAVTARPFTYRKTQCGTADTSGAFPVAGAQRVTIQLIMAQFIATSMDYQLECRINGPAQAWGLVGSAVNKVAVFNVFLDFEVPYDECRVGVKINTDDGDDLTTNTERLTMLVTKRF